MHIGQSGRAISRSQVTEALLQGSFQTIGEMYSHLKDSSGMISKTNKSIPNFQVSFKIPILTAVPVSRLKRVALKNLLHFKNTHCNPSCLCGKAYESWNCLIAKAGGNWNIACIFAVLDSYIPGCL